LPWPWQTQPWQDIIKTTDQKPPVQLELPTGTLSRCRTHNSPGGFPDGFGTGIGKPTENHHFKHLDEMMMLNHTDFLKI
jgi:hypothetical protein